MEFESFGKIPRYSRGIVITEKLDGTNAQVCIGEDGEFRIGSRNRWITPQDDNHGFAMWATQHKDELMQLGAGRHFGEWWGVGIQRGYNMSERRFSLFNAGRWNNNNPPPACCHVVPVIVAGEFRDTTIEFAISELKNKGSFAAPGYMEPEGIVIYHKASNSLFKKTIKDDETPKEIIENTKKVLDN